MIVLMGAHCKSPKLIMIMFLSRGFVIKLKFEYNVMIIIILFVFLASPKEIFYGSECSAV